MQFKDTVALPHHSLFRISSHRITSNSALNGSNSTGQQGTSNHTFKRFLVTLSNINNDINTIEGGKSVNALMEVIHGISRYSNKVKIAPWKSKKT